MFSSGDTQTTKLIQQYYRLKEENFPESEIIKKCAVAVDSEKLNNTKLHDTVEPKSVTQQVLAEADIKNIFKEQ